MRLNKNITERLNLLKEIVNFLSDEKNLSTYLKIANIYTKECRYVSAIKFYKKRLQIWLLKVIKMSNFFISIGFLITAIQIFASKKIARKNLNANGVVTAIRPLKSAKISLGAQTVASH